MNEPKLRFPEFEGPYSTKNFGAIFSLYSTNCLSRDKLSQEQGKVHNIHYGDIHMKYSTILKVDKINIPYIKDDIDISTISKNCYCQNGDIIIADTSEDYADVGKTIEIQNISNEKILAGLHTYLCRDVNKELADGYRGYLMNSPSIHNQVRILATGIKVYSINKANLLTMELTVPSLPEQNKVANFLLTADKKITNQQEQISILEKLKKGFMQKIFSQEIRFKDDNGEEYPEWEEKKLEQILKERKTYAEKSSEYPHVTLSKEGIYDKGERYNRDFLVTTETKEYKITHLDDICYNPANLKFGVICRNNYGDAIFSPIYVTFEVAENFNSIFIGYYCSRWNFINKVRKYEEGTVYERMAVKPTDFLKFKNKFPSLPEQQKIADFLSALDKKIQIEKEILQHWQNIKKGLLQQMFV